MRKFRTILLLFLLIFLSFLAALLQDRLTDTPAYASTKAVEVSQTANQNQSTTIVLDGGHGGYDSGSVGADGTLEKDITLAITLKIGAYLESFGYHIVYTREQDDVPWENDNLTDLQTRVAIAEDADADYFISIHTNFSSYQDGAAGYETYVDGQNYTMIEMAEAIHAQLASLQYTNDRGIKSTEEQSLYVIDHNRIPSLLLEIGFLSDTKDTYYMMTQQDALAEAIAQGIMNIC